MAASVIY